jgi:hypothetical protein
MTKLKKITDGYKPTAVNKYRLANVIFSEKLREPLLQKGRPLTREELDLRLKQDQRLFELVATEFNKPGVDEYDAFQFPHFDQKVSPSLFPDNFSHIQWTDVKDC